MASIVCLISFYLNFCVLLMLARASYGGHQQHLHARSGTNNIHVRCKQIQVLGILLDEYIYNVILLPRRLLLVNF